MNYSDIGGIPVITETNVSEMIASTTGKDTGRGRRERNYNLEPVGSLPYASAAKRPVYSREVLIEMIRDKQRRGRFIHKMALGAGVKVDHQGTTNFCWVQATKKAVEIHRVLSGADHVPLSAASVACPINNFQNRGGWGHKAVRFISENGIAPASMWPDNAIDRKYDNPQSQAARRAFRFTDWIDLTPRNYLELLSCLADDLCCPVGYSWWAHEVLAVDPVILDPNKYGRNALGVMIWNSHGVSYGNGGLAVLTEKYATHDSGYCPLVSTGG